MSRGRAETSPARQKAIDRLANIVQEKEKGKGAKKNPSSQEARDYKAVLAFSFMPSGVHM